LVQAGAIKLTIESRYENVALAGISINRICREAGLTEQVAFEVEVSVVEAVNNAIRHAYCEKPGNEVEICLELTPQIVNLKVADAGRPMPTEILHRAVSQSDGIDRLREGGRGILIIQSLMDRVSYTTDGRRNVLSLCRNLAGSGGPCGDRED
jgi:serine/threonine-protein kinase RsbW